MHHAGAGHDQAVLTLGIEADLRSVFNWNVKQLFVYVTAEYEVRHWLGSRVRVRVRVRVTAEYEMVRHASLSLPLPPSVPPHRLSLSLSLSHHAPSRARLADGHQRAQPGRRVGHHH
eukprot:scaffold13334_cov57-Phaeocystis_antarctica.AAC.1